MKCWDIFRFAHPRRVRPKSSAPNTSSAGFYSRTRVGCDSVRLKSTTTATDFDSRTRAGCDPSNARRKKTPRRFDSRTSVRCDIWIAKIIAFARFRFAHPRRVRQRRLINANRICHQISIHAPTWGATLVANRLILTVAFRFAHPREVRQGFPRRPHLYRGFDSRTRVGCDR